MKKKLLIILTALFIAQICLASALTISSVSTDPSEVQPGEKVTLKLTIDNDLNQDIENVVVTINATSTSAIPFAPYQSSNEERIDEIGEEDKEKVSFDLIALSNAESGTYTIPVTITYTLSDDDEEGEPYTGLVSIIINAKPNIEISSQGSALIKGTSGKITLKIVNSGLGESKFMNVQISKVNGISLTSSDNVYIGNIDSNDFDSADFEVFVDSNSPSTINLPVEITYTDSRNNQITENKIISVKAYTRKEAESLGLSSGSSTSWLIIGVIALVIVYVIYRRIKKKRKNKLSNAK